MAGLDSYNPKAPEKVDFTSSDEWRALAEDERNLLQNDFERRLSWNKKKIDKKELTVEHLQDVAKKLDVPSPNMTDLPNLEGSGLVLLVYRIQKQLKSQDKYLNDGMYGHLTEKSIERKLLAQQERSGVSDDISAPLLQDPAQASRADREPAREREPEITGRASSLEAPRNPDVILSLGCGIPAKNIQRAHLAKDLAARFQGALLIASGGMISKRYQALGTTEADEQGEVWRREGVSNPTFLDRRAGSTYDNINYNFGKIVEIGQRKKHVEVSIVTDSRDHAVRARRNMLTAYEKYLRRNSKNPDAKFELSISLYT